MKTLLFTPLAFLLFFTTVQAQTNWACKNCSSQNGSCSALPKTISINCICKSQSSDLNGNGNVSWWENMFINAGISASLVVLETRTAIGTECYYTGDPNNCCKYEMPVCPCPGGSVISGSGSHPTQGGNGERPYSGPFTRRN